MKKFILFLIVVISSLVSIGQNVQVVNGYLIKKAWDNNALTIFFVKSSSGNFPVFSPNEIIQSISGQDTAIQLYISLDSINQLLHKNFERNGVKIRNESEVFCVKGRYVNTLDKYKDDFFHIMIIPVTVELIKKEPFFENKLNDKNEIEDYKITCLNKVIMSKYFHSPQIGIKSIIFYNK